MLGARRSKIALHEADRAYHEFVDTDRSLKEILKDDLKVLNWQEVFQSVVGMKELRTPAQRKLDEKHFAQGDFSISCEFGIEFREGRRVFYEQRRVAIAIALEELASQDLATMADPTVVIEKIKTRCEHLFFFEPHRAIVLQALGLPDLAPKDSVTACESKKRYFMKVVGDSLLQRDMFIAWEHLWKAHPEGINAQALQAEFEKLGLEVPPLHDLERMLREVDGGENFQQVFEFMVQ